MSFFDPAGIIKGAKSFFSPEEPYEAAEKAAREAWEQAQKYGKPYYEQGQEQYGPLNEARARLMNPAELESEWSQSYETSPYARRMMDVNRQLGEEEASRMGLMGSSGALSNIQEGASDIMARDRQQYLQDLMQKYLAGIGLGQDIYGRGAGMAERLMGGAERQGENMAGLEYNRKAAPGELFGKLLRMGASAYTGGMGGFG